MHKTKLYIDKIFVAPVSNGSFAAINPATEAAFAEVAAGGAADVDLAVRAARRAFDDGPWPQMSASERAGALRRIAKGITQRMSEIAAFETRDNGKPLPDSEWDVGDAAFVFDYYVDLVEAHEAAGAQAVDLGDDAFSSTISTEPIGVVGAITPWNFPLLMAVWKVAPALAAGCTIVLKPSEFCSLSCAILAEIIDAADLHRHWSRCGGTPDGPSFGGQAGLHQIGSYGAQGHDSRSSRYSYYIT
jgi:betaine-aldehyde dehydrogenase